jgi:hypothetical protein
MQLHVGVPTAQRLLKKSKINLTTIIGTALDYMNLKCPQIAMTLNIKF